MERKTGLRLNGLRGLLLLAFGLAVVSPLAADDSLDARRRRVESMEAIAKEQLLRRLEAFESMTPQRKDQLRQLHDQLQQDPQADELRFVMRRYYEWLKTLKPYQRAELAELAPRDRVERVKKILQEQARREAKRMVTSDAARLDRLKRLLQEQVPKGGKRLAAEDVEGLLRWMEQYAVAKEAQLVGDLPPARRQEAQSQLAKATDPARRRELLAVVWFQGQLREPNKPLAIGSTELANLRAQLSPATRDRLQSAPEPEQRRAVTTWIRLLLLHHAASLHRVRASADVSDEELADFLEHKVSSEIRDRLLGLAPEEMRRELWTLYLRSKLPEPAPAVRPARPKPPLGAGKTPRPHAKKPGPGSTSPAMVPPMQEPSRPPSPKDPGKKE